MQRVDSRIPGFYRLPLATRRDELFARAQLDAEALATLEGGITPAAADRLVENAIGVYSLPLGLGLNFRINDRDFLVPMAVEEPSVIAAASNAARMVRAGGGFTAEADAPIMTAQVEIVGVTDPEAARARLLSHTDEILGLARASVPRLCGRGGGPLDFEVRIPHLPAPPPPSASASSEVRQRAREAALRDQRIVVHVHIDCRDAMGANLVNTVAEAIAPRVAELGGGRFGLRILTNLCDRRLVRVQARVPFALLGQAEKPGQLAIDGAAVADDIASASRFAQHDPYRAATHNKGIMNGIDAVTIATGNDWRGIEAGAHAFAARHGHYEPLATWAVEDVDDGCLTGRIELPMALGTVGGTLQVHAGARLSLRILGVETSGELGMVAAAVGLASNLAALRALATEGIQRGHMALHNRAAGKTGKIEEGMSSETTAESAPRTPASMPGRSTREETL